MRIKFQLLKNSFLIIALFSLIVLPLFTPLVVGAGEDKYGLENTAKAAGLNTGETQLPIIVGNIIKYVLEFIGALLLILLLYGGFLWMTSGGNEEQIKKAKGIITNAIIGLAIILAAYAITYFVMDKLTGATGLPGVGRPK